MNRLKKILKISGIVIAVLILFLIAAPFMFKGKIVKAIKTTANSSLNAKLDFDNDISLNFFKNFPNVSLGISKLSVVGIDSFAGDTLAYLPEMNVTLDIMSVISGDEISVKRVNLIQPRIHIETLPSGRANWDVLKEDTTATADTAGSTFKMALDEFSVSKGHLIYDDRSLGFYTELNEFDHVSSGDFTADRFKMTTHTETPSLILGYEGINWLYQIKTNIDADIQMDMKDYKFSYQKGKASLNDLEVESDGFVDLNDSDITMDLTFKALQNDFKSFLSLVPGMYSESFKDVKASGTMGFSGSMTGKMTDDKMPAMNVNLNINNGAFQYPSMPYTADNIFLDLKYANPDGVPDHSVVNIDRFLARLAGEVFNLKLLLKTPVSDPYIDAAAKGKLDLGKIRGLIPLDKGTRLEGLIDADLAAKGNYSSATSQNFSKLDAKGFLSIKNLLYQAVTDKDAYKIEDLALNFTPQKIDVNSCKGNIGKNDFAISGSVQNLLGYMFAEETLTGNVDFKSNYLNVNNLMGDAPADAEPKPADTGQLSIVELPTGIDMKLDASVGKLIYDNYVLTDVGGSAHLHDAQLDMSGLKADMLGGTISLNGSYDSKNVKSPFTKLDTKIEKLNIGESFKYFPMMSKFAPIAEYVSGMFNASIDMSSILNEHMQPNYQSMNVKGMVSFSDAVLTNSAILKQIGKQLNVNWLEKLSLKNQKFNFSIKDGIFQLLDSLVLPLGQGATMKLSGESKLDQTIRYGGWIKVPREALGKANKALDGWISQASSKGWNLGVEKMIPIDLSIVGTLLKPDVKVSLRGFAQSTVSNLKERGTDIAKEEAGKKISEALEKAQKQADKILQEAHNKAELLRQEGKQAAEKIRTESKKTATALRKQGDDVYTRIMNETEIAAKQAEDRVTIPALKKAAGDKVRTEGKKKAEAAKGEFYLKARQAEEEGEKRASQTETEANKRADEVERKAREEADRILKEAESKSKL